MPARGLFFFLTMRVKSTSTSTKGGSVPSAAELLRGGVWTCEQAGMLLDASAAQVAAWCKLGLLPGALWKAGRWAIPGAALFFFCEGRVERRLSPETVAALLDVEVSTVRSWIKHGRLPVQKLGIAKGSPVRIKESDLRRFVDGR
jgi:excisionase family DNA binding protein